MGQNCAGPERFIVYESIYDQFCDACKTTTTTMAKQIVIIDLFVLFATSVESFAENEMWRIVGLQLFLVCVFCFLTENKHFIIIFRKIRSSIAGIIIIIIFVLIVFQLCLVK